VAECRESALVLIAMVPTSAVAGLLVPLWLIYYCGVIIIIYFYIEICVLNSIKKKRKNRNLHSIYHDHNNIMIILLSRDIVIVWM